MAEILRRQKDELVQWFNDKGQKACKAFSNVNFIYANIVICIYIYIL